MKLPSAEAESETPGEEKPFMRDGFGTGAGIGVSGAILVTCVMGGELDGVAAGTKMRVNSPAAEAGGAGLGAGEEVITGAEA